MYRVSVIIPVYNNEDTFEVVIDSFLNQTMPGFELILINDGLRLIIKRRNNYAKS